MILTLAPLAADAADRAACTTRCGERMADCSKTCKDDKCVKRCSDQLMPCQAGCEGEVQKASKGAAKEYPPPPRNLNYSRTRQ
jgi:hypothetical protein